MKRDELIRLIEDHGKTLTRFCLKLCRSRSNAEDLYQETWCRVISKFQQYDASKPFQPWLFSICINIFRNIYKKEKRTLAAEFDSSEEQEWTISTTTGSNPVFNEDHDQIRQIVNELNEKHRIVIVLHYFSDYSVKEIASIIGIPQGTVKSRLDKARKIIKGRLEDNER